MWECIPPHYGVNVCVHVHSAGIEHVTGRGLSTWSETFELGVDSVDLVKQLKHVMDMIHTLVNIRMRRLVLLPDRDGEFPTECQSADDLQAGGCRENQVSGAPKQGHTFYFLPAAVPKQRRIISGKQDL